MNQHDTPTDLERGDEYHHPSGTVEVLVAVSEGRILTLREYPTERTFRRTVDEATYEGTNEEVAGLPPVEVFRDEGGDPGDGTATSESTGREGGAERDGGPTSDGER